MRTLTCLPLAVALIGATAYAAPQAEQTEPALSEIQVHGVMPTYKPTPAQIADVQGTFVFDNGTALKVTKQNRRLFAELGSRGVTEMIPSGENRFVSADQRMSMEYVPEGFNDHLVLIYPADQNVASSPMVTARIAMN